MVVVSSCLLTILILSYHNKCWVVIVCSRTANLHNDLYMTVSIVSACIIGIVISAIQASVQIESCVMCVMICDYLSLLL